MPVPTMLLRHDCVGALVPPRIDLARIGAISGSINGLMQQFEPLSSIVRSFSNRFETQLVGQQRMSAARTFVAEGVSTSTIAFSSVVTAALVAC